jgi:hypothetical protein
MNVDILGKAAEKRQPAVRTDYGTDEIRRAAFEDYATLSLSQFEIISASPSLCPIH